jgi:pimeloyl-ACP methyl ester carboxylesterase
MIRLIRHGTPTATHPLLSVPGIDGSIGSIAPLVEKLSQRREVIVVDYTAETNATLEALAGEIARVVKAEVHGAFDVHGQSIGTILAAQLPGLHGLPVRKVVLTCTFIRLNWNKLRFGNLMMSLTPGWLYRLTSPLTMKIVCGPVGDGKQRPFFAAARNSDKSTIKKRTAWQINRDFSADLARIQSPLLILMGEEDRFVPNATREIEKLRQLFANHDAKVVAIPHAGHVLLPSAAISFAVRHIEAFLSSRNPG